MGLKNFNKITVIFYFKILKIKISTTKKKKKKPGIVDTSVDLNLCHLNHYHKNCVTLQHSIFLSNFYCVIKIQIS